METPKRANSDVALERLLKAYRESCPGPEPSVNFMPELWARIEARKTFSYALRRLASGFVTAAVALTVAMAVYLYLPGEPSPYYSESYIESLSAPYVEALAARSSEAADLLEPVRFEPSDWRGEL